MVKFICQNPPTISFIDALNEKFFAAFFGVSKGAVSIISGDTARLKRVKITGMTAEKAILAFSAVMP